MDTNCNKQLLQRILAEIVKELRLKQKKSISLSSAEIGITKSIWADLEKGIKDPQLSTVWRIAEGLEIQPSQLIKLIEEKLGKNFTFLD